MKAFVRQPQLQAGQSYEVDCTTPLEFCAVVNLSGTDSLTATANGTPILVTAGETHTVETLPVTSLTLLAGATVPARVFGTIN